MPLDPDTKELLLNVSIFSAVIASVTGGAIQFLNGWRERVSEKNRQIRELAAQLALEYWKRQNEVDDSKNLDGNLSLNSLRVQLENMAELVSALNPSKRKWWWISK